MFNSSGLEEFRDFLHCCAEERVEKLGQVFITNRRYQSLFDEKSGLFNQIIDALPEDFKQVLIDYEDKESALSGMEETFFYENGFMDAFMLLKILLG